MATAQAILQDTEISFFGADPTVWNILSNAQRTACTGLRMPLKIADLFAWGLNGVLCDQWNADGLPAFNAVKNGSRRGKKIPSPQLFLLSEEDRPELAVPTVVVTCTHERHGREIIKLFTRHQSLAVFQLPYRWRPSDMRFPAKHVSENDQDDLIKTTESSADLTMSSMSVSGQARAHLGHFYVNTNISDQTGVHLGDVRFFGVGDVFGVLPPLTLCGARIAVYTGPQTFRNPKRNIATIAGLIRVGQKRYALTTAHAFFDNVNTTGSWKTSNLSVPVESHFTNKNSSTLYTDSALTDLDYDPPAPPDPSVNQVYEVVIESLWPHTIGPPEEMGILSDAIGEVSPRLTRDRKDAMTKALPEVIFNYHLDCALIEIRDTSLWLPNHLQLRDGSHLRPRLPVALDKSESKPPKEQVFVATGISGPVQGTGLGTNGGIILPWRQTETPAWSIQAEIAVGDSGALAMSPKNGLSYGIIVSHDPSILMTYIVPMHSVLDFITTEVGADISFLPELSPEHSLEQALQDIEAIGGSSDIGNVKGKPDRGRRSLNNKGQLAAINVFLTKLEQYTMRNVFGCKFILTHQLTDWLLSTSEDGDGTSVKQVERLIDAVYPEELALPVLPEELYQEGSMFLLVFSILLELRQGHLIYDFRRLGIHDNRLPLLSLDQLKISLSGVGLADVELADFAQSFLKTQWAYCPFRFDNQIAASLDPDCVLPIIQRQRINNKGATAAIWEVTVPEEFVGRRLQRLVEYDRFETASDKRGQRYVFAIKTFPHQYESVFRAEREAFRLLKDNSEFVRCFGDFTQRDGSDGVKYNLLLEYGDFDLAEYYMVASPPVLPIQIYDFWKNLLNIVKAVQDLHSFSVERVGTQRTFYGWHQDIKPDNILSVKGIFKLADPGFAHFSQGDDSKDIIKGGTEQYGPPESNAATRKKPAPGRSSDIWSLGCVFSEAATWIVLGSQGLKQYANFRRQTQRSLDIGSDDATRPMGVSRYHNGQDVSSQVLEWHRYLRQIVRRTDNVTSAVLDIVEQRMLQSKPEDRISASQLHSTLVTILGNAAKSETAMLFEKEESMKHLLQLITYNPPPYGRTVPRSGRPIEPGPLPTASVALPAARMDPPELPERLLQPSTQKPGQNATSGSTTSLVPSKPTTRHIPRHATVSKQNIFDAYYFEEENSKQRYKDVFSRHSGSRKRRDNILARYIASRDITFLVDNAGSMEAHWNTVRFVLDILTRKVSGMDNDGFSVQFTGGTDSFFSNGKESNRKKLNDMLLTERVRPVPGTTTNITTPLRNVLSSYLDQVRLHKRQTPELTLIVLTDGLWEGSTNADDVESVVSDFADKLLDLDKTSINQSKRVSLEFVWFGGDPVIAEKMRALDSELNPRNLPLTIDTEPWDGDIYKMLLGSFVEQFDDLIDSGFASPRISSSPLATATFQRTGSDLGLGRIRSTDRSKPSSRVIAQASTRSRRSMSNRSDVDDYFNV